MDQQVRQLYNAGIKALRVMGNEQFDEALEWRFRFVLMSPEHAVSPPWRTIFGSPFFKRNLTVVAIDEAHCISEWGRDFRESFSRLGGLRALTKVPFMAVTASAPPDVEAAILSSLHMRDPVLVTQPLDNFLSARKGMGMKRDFGGLAHILATSDDPSTIPKTIIFSRAKDEVYSFLRTHAVHKHVVSMYHASQSEETKSFTQSNFGSAQTELKCLSATIAFGMGMDIPDVELVVVNGPPDTLAQLYQMFGRAGRDGCQARAHLIYTTRQTKPISDSSLTSFISEGNQENCQRKEMLVASGSRESISSNVACCDICSGGIVPSPKLDVLVTISLKRVSLCVTLLMT